jgi:hypothetical protein
MGKYIKLVVGVLLIIFGVTGPISLMSGQYEEVGRHIAENGIDVTGVVEKRERHILVGRVGPIPGGTVYYTMTYKFTTREGETYGGEVDVSKEQAYSLQDGQTITVRYLDGQPSINAPTAFKHYFSAEDAENVPYGTFIVSSLMFFLGGAWLAWSGWSKIRPAAPAGRSRVAAMRSQAMASSSPAPAAAAPRGRSGFGKR